MLTEPLLPPWPERSPAPQTVADQLCLQGRRVTYTYKTGGCCRQQKKWTVTAFYRNIAAPDGKPLGVTAAYKYETC
jgi:hypothetical protein